MQDARPATDEARPFTRFSVSQVSPAIGAEIGELDLRETLDEQTIAELRRALVRHKVLFFRDQDITPTQHVELARRFGELEIHPVLPHHSKHEELVLLGGDANVKANENVYHTDVSWREIPSMGSMLRCVECPKVGGDTIWVNMAAAYTALAQPIKDKIEGLYAVHDIMPAFAKRMTPEERVAMRAKYPPATHPVVRTHPESGEKILYVNEAFVTHFSNYAELHTSRGGSDYRHDQIDLLTYLYRQAAFPEYQVRLRWRPNTIAFWDNRSTHHYAVQDYFPAVRRMMRATIIGDRPR